MEAKRSCLLIRLTDNNPEIVRVWLQIKLSRREYIHGVDVLSGDLNNNWDNERDLDNGIYLYYGEDGENWTPFHDFRLATVSFKSGFRLAPCSSVGKRAHFISEGRGFDTRGRHTGMANFSIIWQGSPDTALKQLKGT